jgi:hypothetical protein
MTPDTEAALARCLADIGLSLGEYMELMEESYLQTAAVSPEDCLSHAQVDARAKKLASQRLQSYARAKRRYTLTHQGESRRMFLPPPLLQAADPFSMPVLGGFWIMTPADRDSLRDSNRRLIREMRNDIS